MSDQSQTAVPHPHEIVRREALNLMMKLDGKDPRPETAVLVQWLMSHRWYQIKSLELAANVWADLAAQGDGTNVAAAVDTIVELTMRVLAELQYHGLYTTTLEAFLQGQRAFEKSQSIHEHLLEKLPFVKPNTVVSGIVKTPQQTSFNAGQPTQIIEYDELIKREPWIMVCHLLLRSGVLQTLSNRVETRPQRGEGRTGA